MICVLYIHYYYYYYYAVDAESLFHYFTRALNRIIEKDPELVNIRKSDGYAPLHVAALKNHAGIVQILLDKVMLTLGFGPIGI